LKTRIAYFLALAFLSVSGQLFSQDSNSVVLTDTVLFNLSSSLLLSDQQSLADRREATLRFEKVRLTGKVKIHGNIFPHVSFSSCTIDTLAIGYDLANVDLVGTTVSHLIWNLWASKVNRLAIESSAIPHLVLNRPGVDTLIINNSRFRRVSLREIKAKTVKLSFSELPDTLELMDVDLSGPQSKIDLYTLKPAEKTCYISFFRVDFDKVEFNYNYYRLFFPKHYLLDYEEKVNVYHQLLNKFRVKGMYQSYEKLDREFKEFKYLEGKGFGGSVLNWVDRHWWGYGYSKFLVVRNALLLNFIFFIINSFVFRQLVHRGYRIEKFARINTELNKKFKKPFTRYLAKSPYVFLYTSYIFWGLRLDVNNISVHKIGMFAYVLLQYVTGVVCLAYVANLIITI
jgi:hypothetical protein